MDKRISEVLVDAFLNKFAKEHPEFVRVRMVQTDVAGAPVLEWKLDKLRKAWIVFGGASDNASTVALFAGWTTEGRRYKEAEPCWGNGQIYPKSGILNVLMENQFSEEPTDYDGLVTRVCIDEPSIELQKRVVDMYLLSDKYKADLDFAVKWESRRKVPPTLEQLTEQKMRAERAFCQLWTHLLDRDPECKKYLEIAVRSAVDKAMALIDQKALPFIKERLDAA